MSKQHGARQQKKLAKQKAKRAEKRAELARRDSQDPNMRLQRAATWPVYDARVAAEIWNAGIGHVVIARQQGEGQIVAGVYLVDVFCLGVKDAFWQVQSVTQFKEMIKQMDERQSMRAMSPECVAKIVTGAVEFARSFGFAPHADFRHASKLLEGLDPAGCAQEFTYGRDGKPLYINGPYESPAQVQAILERINQADGHFAIGGPARGGLDFEDLEEVEEEPPKSLDYDDETA